MTTPAPAAASRADPGSSVNILLVDDRADKLFTLQVMLEELGENLVVARSGKEALRRLLAQDFAVILLDVNMPVMDGFETAAMIRQRGRSETTPIIFFSAINDTENHVSRGYSLGAVDYILTPVVPEILRAKVAVFVDLFRKTEQVKRQAEDRAEFIREQAARAEAEAAQDRLAFLADASNVLAGSLDMQETFENLARLVVPRMADFCIIDVAGESGGLRRVAVAHRDPVQEATLRQLSEHHPLHFDESRGATRVFQTGKSEISSAVDDELLGAMFENPETLAYVRTMAPASYVAVPLLARGRVLGAITMVNVDADRGCGPKELALAEELAQRAALALDNAALYNTAQKARQEAERANLAKDRFLAMLSHELRTPLTPVVTAVLSLEQTNGLPEFVRDDLAMIRRNVELEARLIDDLLDLTRISKGKVQLRLQVVEARKLLETSIEICRAEIEAKRLEVKIDWKATRTHVMADSARLQQVFWNLIINGLKFTPPGGSLTITSGNEENGEMRVEIRDTGIGIPAAMLPKIFDAFEQGEMARIGGLGLGLAITKTIVDLHHGRIAARSDGENQGSTFSIWFPTVDEQPALAASGAPQGASERHALRVLLVEDHEDSNRSLTRLLTKRGYEVRSAFDVANAMQAAAEFSFDVLVSDMGLPDGSGIDLLRNLLADRPVYGIALTGYGMESDLQNSYEAGFQHHLVKPIDLDRLDSLIQAGQPAAETSTR